MRKESDSLYNLNSINSLQVVDYDLTKENITVTPESAGFELDLENFGKLAFPKNSVPNDQGNFSSYKFDLPKYLQCCDQSII